MDREEASCVVQQAIRYLDDFLAGPMCGKCFPCSFGSYEAEIRLKRIASGLGEPSDIVALEHIAAQMFTSSMCKKGKDTAVFLQERLKEDAEVFAEHIAGRCSEKECVDLVTYRIVPEKCDRCGLCRPACKYEAVVGQTRVSFFTGFVPFQIRQKKCVKCDECVTVCPYGAIEAVSGEEEEAEVPAK